MTDKKILQQARRSLRPEPEPELPPTGLDFFKGLGVALLLAAAFWAAAFAVASTWWR